MVVVFHMFLSYGVRIRGRVHKSLNLCMPWLPGAWNPDRSCSDSPEMHMGLGEGTVTGKAIPPPERAFIHGILDRAAASSPANPVTQQKRQGLSPIPEIPWEVRAKQCRGHVPLHQESLSDRTLSHVEKWLFILTVL